MKRLFWIVLDSFGIGALPDAGRFGDEGSNTLGALQRSGKLRLPNLERLGLFQMDGVAGLDSPSPPQAAIARMAEASLGKDTTTGHWEMAGIISEKPFPTYPQGFPPEVLEPFQQATGRGVLCNRPYSGTQVIQDFGQEHLRSGSLIVYTSADSVFQIAAHESLVPPELLYRYCEQARTILTGKHGVGRVIARPFAGESPRFYRTENRRDFSLRPPADTLLDHLKQSGLDVIAVGKIHDIFAGQGITESIHTGNNREGMDATQQLLNHPFHGLCFTNLVDFDMLYGHRNDVAGYARAMNEFDRWLGDFLPGLEEEDALLITADHGCDPSTPSTDHSREYTPMLFYGQEITPKNLGTRSAFADLGKTVEHLFGLSFNSAGNSFWEEIHHA